MFNLPDGVLATHALRAAMCAGEVDWEQFLDWMDVDPLGDPLFAWWTGFLTDTPDWDARLLATTLSRLPSLEAVAENAGLIAQTGVGGGSLSDFCGDTPQDGIDGASIPDFGPSLCLGCSTVLVDCTPEQDPGGTTPEPPPTLDYCGGGFVNLEYRGCDVRTCDPSSALDTFNFGHAPPGGNTLRPRTIRALNSENGFNASREAWNHAMHDLKGRNSLRNDNHGRIMSNGDYLNPFGEVIGNLIDYLPGV